MARWLKQSTSFTLRIGPFVDRTDGYTAETGLTIANTDIRISKNGGAFGAKNSGGGTHGENGWYSITLDATDTNTLGPLTLAVHKTADALPVWHDFMVVPANEYDSLISGTDALDVEVSSMAANTVTATAIASNAITSAKIAASAIGATQIATDAITAAKIAADAIGASELAADAVAEIADAVWDELQSGHVTAGSFGEIASEIADILVDTAEIGAAGAGLTAVPWNAAWDAQVESEVTDGLNAYDPPTYDELEGFVQLLARSDAAINTDRATLLSAINADEGSGAGDYDNQTDAVEAIADSGGGGPTAAQIADAVWDEAQADHTTAGTFGEVATEVASILADTGTDGVVLANDAITAAKIASDAITSAKIAASAIGSSQIGTNAITASKIAADAIGASELAADAVAEIADAVWEELIADHSATSGSTAEALANASSAGDPWSTALPGAYGAGTAGNILGNNLDATVSSRSSHTAANVRTEMDSNSTRLSAIVADTNELQTDDVPGLIAALNDPTAAAIADAVWDEAQSAHVTAGTFGELATEIAAILADTSTDGVVLTAAERNAVADALLGRNVSNTEGTAPEHSLTTIVLAILESEISGSTWTIKRTDGSTTHATKTVTTNASADPITAVS